MAVSAGIDTLFEESLELIRGRRLGVLTHHAAVDHDLRHLVDRLVATPGITVVRLFGPEHGVRGAVQAGAKVSDGVDPATGIPVVSLYGERHRPTPDLFAGLDALVIDLQDLGVRNYTYSVTMAYALEAASEAGIQAIVLDRPAPLGGEGLDGPCLEAGYESLLGLRGLPMRYSLTIGELARYHKRQLGLDLGLTVVPVRGWQRREWLDETGLPWVAPSPNIPTLDSATLFTGTVLVEATNLSEGRGTTRPFELIGAPYVEPHVYARHLNELHLPGVQFRPAYFQPTFQKYVGETCGGVQVHVRERQRAPLCAIGLHLIATARSLYPEAFAWRPPRGDGNHWIDRLAGTATVREALDAGVPVAEIVATWQPNLEGFRVHRQEFLLY